MRRTIEVRTEGKIQYGQSQNYFSISYDGSRTERGHDGCQQVGFSIHRGETKGSRQQAGKTSDFLVKELEALEDALKKKEQAIRRFKEENMGQLPEQLDANVRTLERLQQQLQTNESKYPNC